MPLYSALMQAAENQPAESKIRELLDQFLTFIYSLAHWFGSIISQAIGSILNYALPPELIDPLGFLVILTLFLAIAEIAKKLAWLVIVVGWILIILRIVIEVLDR